MSAPKPVKYSKIIRNMCELKSCLLFVMLCGILFYAPVAAFSTVKVSDEQRKTEEKSAERIEEVVRGISRLSNLKAAGASNSFLPANDFQNISNIILTDLNLPDTQKFVNLPTDPRLSWNSDSSPPVYFS